VQTFAVPFGQAAGAGAATATATTCTASEVGHVVGAGASAEPLGGMFGKFVRWESLADGWGSPEDNKEKKTALWQERVRQAQRFPTDHAEINQWAAKITALRKSDMNHTAEQCPFPEGCVPEHRPADTF
jgi:hypothetical protein